MAHWGWGSSGQRAPTGGKHLSETGHIRTTPNLKKKGHQTCWRLVARLKGRGRATWGWGSSSLGSPKSHITLSHRQFRHSPKKIQIICSNLLCRMNFCTFQAMRVSCICIYTFTIVLTRPWTMKIIQRYDTYNPPVQGSVVKIEINQIIKKKTKITLYYKFTTVFQFQNVSLT